MNEKTAAKAPKPEPSAVPHPSNLMLRKGIKRQGSGAASVMGTDAAIGLQRDFSKVPLRSDPRPLPIQAKLKIGAPNDRYEQEADRVNPEQELQTLLIGKRYNKTKDESHYADCIARFWMGQNFEESRSTSPRSRISPRVSSATSCQTRSPSLLLTPGAVREYRDRHMGYVISAGNSQRATYVGMLFTGQLDIIPPSCGDLFFVQNVQPFREFTYADNSRCRNQATDWGLDTRYPYGTDYRNLSGNRLLIATSDSPSQATGILRNQRFTERSISRMIIRDEFRMFLIFRQHRTSGGGGHHRPILVANWLFSAQADNRSGSLSLTTGRITHGRATHPSTPPVSNPIINADRLQFVVSFRPSSGRRRTLADRFLTILNP